MYTPFVGKEQEVQNSDKWRVRSGEQEQNPEIRRAVLIEVGFLPSGHFEKVPEQANLEGLVAVNWNRKPDDAP